MLDAITALVSSLISGSVLLPTIRSSRTDLSLGRSTCTVSSFFRSSNSTMGDVWVCCQCDNSTLIANDAKTCHACYHIRCGFCTTGCPGFSYHRSNKANSSRAYTSRGSGNGGQISYVRPSMANWWYCCNCNNLNNPELCCDVCLCGHSKCDLCPNA